MAKDASASKSAKAAAEVTDVVIQAVVKVGESAAQSSGRRAADDAMDVIVTAVQALTKQVVSKKGEALP